MREQNGDNEDQEMEAVLISIGEPFPLFQGNARQMIGQEGAIFEAAENGQGYMFCLYMGSPRPEEIKAVQSAPVSFRVVEEGGKALPMIMFGDQLVYEMVFDPTLYKDGRALQFMDKNNILAVYLIDSENNVVKAIRQGNLPLKFIQMCGAAWSRAAENDAFSENFNAWYAELQNDYLPDQLWEQGIDVGKLGDSYDLNEIKKPRTI